MASNSDKKSAEKAGEQALAKVDYKAGGLISMDHEDLMSGGSSDFGREDLSIPFIRIVQALSPVLQRGDVAYNPDAKQGMIIETVTPRLFDGDRGIIIIPVLYQRSYTEWAPDRGGLVQDYGSDPTILESCKTVEDSDGRKKLLTPAGNELAEAAQYYVMFSDLATQDGYQFDQAILTMAGTQWKKARDWNTNMSRVVMRREDGTPIKNPLPFAKAYHFHTLPEKKDNYNFFGWKISPLEFTLALPNGEELVKQAAAFRKLALSGRVKGAEDTVSAHDPLASENF